MLDSCLVYAIRHILFFPQRLQIKEKGIVFSISISMKCVCILETLQVIQISNSYILRKTNMSLDSDDIDKIKTLFCLFVFSRV